MPTRSSSPPCARRSSATAAAVIGYEGVSVPPPARWRRSRTTSSLRELLVREIRTFRPDAVLATDPEACSTRDGASTTPTTARPAMAAVDAVYPAARNPMAFPALARGGLAAHKVRRLYLFWSNRPNAWVDISATLERKIDALAGARQPDPRARPASAERIRAWAAEEGARDRRGRGRSPPRVVVIDDDEDEGPG